MKQRTYCQNSKGFPLYEEMEDKRFELIAVAETESDAKGWVKGIHPNALTFIDWEEFPKDSSYHRVVYGRQE